MWFIYIGLHKDRIQDYLNSLPGTKVRGKETSSRYIEYQEVVLDVVRCDLIKEEIGDIFWFLICCSTRRIK